MPDDACAAEAPPVSFAWIKVHLCTTKSSLRHKAKEAADTVQGSESCLWLGPFGSGLGRILKKENKAASRINEKPDQ